MRDKNNTADVTMDFAHYKVHDSQMYEANYYFTITAASSNNFFIKTGSGEPHVSVHVAVGGQTLVRFYENISISAGNTGTAVPIRNLHRDSSNSGTVLCFRDTVWSSGAGSNTVLLSTDLLPGGDHPTTRIGTSARDNTEWILKSNNQYAIQLTNQAGSTIGASVNIEFYELEV